MDPKVNKPFFIAYHPLSLFLILPEARKQFDGDDTALNYHRYPLKSTSPLHMSSSMSPQTVKIK